MCPRPGPFFITDLAKPLGEKRVHIEHEKGNTSSIFEIRIIATAVVTT